MSDWDLRKRWPVSEETTDALLNSEWLVANGLGGYASGTVAGVASRGYHSLLVAALPAPLGRYVMLHHLSEWLKLPDGREVELGGEERAGGALSIHGAAHLKEFRLERGLPVWCFETAGIAWEKRILLPHRQNTVHVGYRLLEANEPIGLRLRPSVHFRPHDSPVNVHHPGPYTFTAVDRMLELSVPGPLPPLRLYLHGDRPAFALDGRAVEDVLYRVEESRGYEALGALWSPGYFRVDLTRGTEATLVASTESWDVILAIPPVEALEAERSRRARLIDAAEPSVQKGPARQLILAADQFLVEPAGRVEDAIRAHAGGDDVRTVIAGYHWFTDWGRDTMISLEGLTLTTGRHDEAGYILRTFAHYIRDGLIPNLFPEGEKEGHYHTADATLWYFQALARYLAVTGDSGTLRLLLPKLEDIVEHHLRGTRFGIGVDPVDGLLRQGEQGYALTWMDAKVGDWVVTPRRGKAVEINALWYNALRLLESWLREENHETAAARMADYAAAAHAAFNRRFWFAEGGHLYDVVDGENGDDPACRPNQVLAMSLTHPVLERSRWEAVLRVVADKLLTPVGLRSLSADHPDYKPRYYGNLRARDAAYHQGTVWAWLIGPFIQAWLEMHPENRSGARELLRGFVDHLGEACLGSISEIFDAEEPFTPRGCVAQAWSVAEVLRCWALTSGPE
jgi:predicted glycogen debranching enzyme